MAKKNKIVGIVNLSEDESGLRELTTRRPLASIPFGGRYRVIDFALSNLTNAGIETVGIFLGEKERSLMDHIRSGRPWGLDGMNGGLFIYSQSDKTTSSFDLKGDILNYYNNRDILERSGSNYVLVTGTNYVTSIDFKKVLEEHIKSGAEITTVYKSVASNDHYFDNAYVLNTDEDEKVTSFGMKIVKENKVIDKKRKDMTKISLNMFLMETEIFNKILEDTVEKGVNAYLTETLQEACNSFNMRGYAFDGFIGYLSTVNNYFDTNMELLKEKNLMELFYGDSRIYTKAKNESPSHYGKNAKVSNSLIANGCVIEGEVSNSILFRRVRVEKGARIENSIVMQNCIIKKDSALCHVILDKNVTISDKAEIKGSKKHPLVIEKDSVV